MKHSGMLMGDGVSVDGGAVWLVAHEERGEWARARGVANKGKNGGNTNDGEVGVGTSGG